MPAYVDALSQMSRDAYLKRMRTDSGWAPGWDAITGAFAAVYGKAGEYVPAASVDGVSATLEGFGVYHSHKGYRHIVTRGLSRIYPHECAYHGMFSGWGLELTVKWADGNDPASTIPFLLLDWIAQWMEVTKCGHSTMRSLPLNFKRVNGGFFAPYVSKLCVAPDTEIPETETVHGKLVFLQLVNVSEEDRRELRSAPGRIAQLVFCIKKTNPALVFEQGEPASYLI